MKNTKLFIVFLLVSLIMSNSFSSFVREEHPHSGELSSQNVSRMEFNPTGYTMSQSAAI